MSVSARDHPSECPRIPTRHVSRVTLGTLEARVEGLGPRRAWLVALGQRRAGHAACVAVTGILLLCMTRDTRLGLGWSVTRISVVPELRHVTRDTRVRQWPRQRPPTRASDADFDTEGCGANY